MKPGYAKPLYLLPFDHRNSFVEDMFHFQFPLSDVQHQKVVAVKQIIYEGLLAAIAKNKVNPHAAILVDEQFGSTILRDAKKHNLVTAVSVEKSGRTEFEFEYGADFGQHIELFAPTFAKVLVRFNPEGDPELNDLQLARLFLLSSWCRRNDQLFMFELLVPATKDQLRWYHSDLHAYDRKCRPGLMVQAICAIQDAGIEPDVWKIEGLDEREDCLNIVEAARRNGRNEVGCIVLGRGENEKKIADWLSMAGSVPGFIGFAVGRTTFWSAIADLGSRLIDRKGAIARIAERYQMWVSLFEHRQPKDQIKPVKRNA